MLIVFFTHHITLTQNRSLLFHFTICIPCFRNLKFLRVCSLVCRYFYNVYIESRFEIVFSFNVKDNTIFPRLHNIRLSITYRNASVTWLDRACLHKTVNMLVFFVKGNENTYPKGRSLKQMYRVVPISKRGNVSKSKCSTINYIDYNSCGIL